MLTGGEFGAELPLIAVALYLVLALCAYLIPFRGRRAFLASGSGPRNAEGGPEDGVG